MQARWFLVAVALALSAYTSDSQYLEQLSEAEMVAHSHFQKLVDFLSDTLSGRESEMLSYEPQDWGSVNKFSFTNCGKPSEEIVVVTSASLKPDPLKLPGNVTVGGAATIKQQVDKPLKVALDVHYKVLGMWVHVPCVDNVGSCTYNDVCSMIKVKDCPPAILKAGLTCECPFPAGNFTVAKAVLPVKQKLPVSGDMKVKAEVSENGKVVTCAEVQLKLA